MKPTRQEALRLGLSRCYGSVCKSHPELGGQRYVSGSCVACSHEANQKIRRANPDKTRFNAAKSNAVQKSKPEAVAKKRALDAAYRADNKEKIAETIREWRNNNRDLVRTYTKKCKLKNPHVVVANTAKRRNGKDNRTPNWLVKDDHWMMREAYALAALRTKMFGFSWHVDHIIPLHGKNVSGLHVPLNLQVIPGAENVRKGSTYKVS